MDRRNFLKAFMSASVLTPMIMHSGIRFHPYSLYVISDYPQDHLPSIIAGLRERGLSFPRLFSFKTRHPHQRLIMRSLQDRGYRLSDSQGGPFFHLSHAPLFSGAQPSFSFLRNGKIEDIRISGLSGTWASMQKKEKPSSCLTIASVAPPQPGIAPGQAVGVFQNGKRIDSLSLQRNTNRSYFVKQGRVDLRIKDGGAFIESAPCDHKICCAAHPISTSGERILCAPSRFFIEVAGSRLFDTITG